MFVKSLHVLITSVLVVLMASADSLLDFVDPQSFFIVIVPVFTAYLVGSQKSVHAALRSAMHMSWISGVVGTLISLGYVLNQSFDVDLIGIMVGVKIALLPITYGVTGVLLLLPLVIAHTENKV